VTLLRREPDVAERDVVELARAIAAAGAGAQTELFHLSWWSERMLDWALAHPTFKTQLFRFVDVFPACRDDGEVMRHLEEYFEGVPVPAAVDLGLTAAAHVPFGARVTATVARRNIRRMARQLIAGADAASALARLARLWEQGEAATVDLLGEKTVSDDEADRYAARVADLLETLAAAAPRWPARPVLERDPWGPVPRVNVSVKPTALSPRFHPHTAEAAVADVTERLRPVLRRARELGATVHLDMEHRDVKDVTLELVRRLAEEFPDGPQLGCVVQAYLRDSHDDLRALVAWSSEILRVPLQVRLVKGAYWDAETIESRAHGWPSPVYQRKGATDANYERCVRLLVAHAGAVRPAFATHNLRSIAYAVSAVRAAGLPDDAAEVQLLYGMAEPVHVALRAMGLRVRVYAPVGELVAGMAYLVRRLLENTSNESFIRHRFVEGRELERLVAAPDPRDAPDGAPPGAPAGAPPGPGEVARRDGAGRGGGDVRRGGPRRGGGDGPRSGPGLDGDFANEPVAELRRPAVRRRLGQAVAAAADAAPFEAPVLIGGRPVRTADEIASTDPGSPSREVCRSGAAGPDEADRAVSVALAAAPAWRRVPWDARAAVLVRAAAIMRARRDELAALEVFEAGKPWPEADADVCEAIDFCEYYAHEARRMGAGVPIVQAPGETNAYRYEPRGVGVVIAPWNFPLAIPCGMTAAALVTGNPVVLKPAEQTPGIAHRLVQILHEAGVPPDALSFLPGHGEVVGAHLVDHPQVSFVVFTGSREVGLGIVASAAVHRPGQGHVKRVVAEMGGKNAVVVDADADLDVAVPAIVQSAFGYAGQKCSAASRVVALAPVYDELCDRIVGAARALTVGHPRDLAVTVGPLIERSAQERVRSYRDRAAAEGTVLLARDDVPDTGWFVGPTVVALHQAAGRVFRDEIFGPLLALVPAASFDEAVAVANDTDYALTAGVFSRSPARIRHAAAELRAGNLYVNRGITGAMVGRQPFGGYGLSGVGSKAGGPDYLRQFVDPRVVTENTLRQGFAPQEP
jgi:RHH-type proline utilization regulon transcriptional repressor/proline dehydrogenase/delta 1-pyrroline-5-carboxylate dehydrogenase